MIKNYLGSTSFIKKSFIVLAAIAFLVGGFFVSIPQVFADASVTTNAATSITSTDATLNGTNGLTDATGHSFWVSTSTFSTVSSIVPTGVYSTADFGLISSSTAFSVSLSSITGILPVTPDTTYYFAAWSLVDGAWIPGTVVDFTTIAVPVSANFVDLGSANDFAILAYAGITDVPTSIITGNIGVSPLAGSTIGVPCEEFTGVMYAVDATGPACVTINATLLTTAMTNLGTAYNIGANGQATSGYGLNRGASGDLAGLTLVPGVYTFSGDSNNVRISTDLTLNGGADDVWVFQIPGTFDVSAHVLLTGGAQAKNIFWAVAGQTTLHAGSTLEGSILGYAGIALQSGAVLHGRALSQTESVTLIANTITAPVDPLPGTLSAPDFDVMDFSGVKGYSAGFNLTSADFTGATVVVKLYSGDTLLQTNTATTTGFTGLIEISSPFDVLGSFNYVTDGYWTNVRGSEYGQTLTPTKVVATVTLANGKVVTAENTHLNGTPITLSSIIITHPATKLSYTVGDVLDISGLVVVGTYSDTSTTTLTITTGNITGFNSDTPVAGQTLTVTVGTATTTYPVDVIAAPVTPPVPPVSHGGGSSCKYGYNFELRTCNRNPNAATPAIPAVPGESPAVPAIPSINSNGRVLGASTFKFIKHLGQGGSSDAVMQLQERLRGEGYFTFHTSTGYFGPITLQAVKEYQAAHGINPVTGFVGVLTTAELNK